MHHVLTLKHARSTVMHFLASKMCHGSLSASSVYVILLPMPSHTLQSDVPLLPHVRGVRTCTNSMEPTARQMCCAVTGGLFDSEPHDRNVATLALGCA
jgi:hypothetical protein